MVPPNRWIQPGEEHLITEGRTFFYNFIDGHVVAPGPGLPATYDGTLAYMVNATYLGGMLMIPGEHPMMPTLTEWARKGCAAHAEPGNTGPEIIGPGRLCIPNTRIIFHVRAYVLTPQARMRNASPSSILAWERGR
jgi:hypothetical protein